MKKIEPCNDYKGLLAQFNAAIRIIDSKEKQVKFYTEQNNDLTRQLLILSNSRLQSELDMNHELTVELNKAQDRILFLEQCIKNLSEKMGGI